MSEHPRLTDLTEEPARQRQTGHGFLVVRFIEGGCGPGLNLVEDAEIYLRGDRCQLYTLVVTTCWNYTNWM